jgi:hypothetical protein
MTDRITVRFQGGPLDTVAREIDALNSEPPPRLSVPVSDDSPAGGRRVYYRPTGHVWSEPGEPEAYLYVIDQEITQAELDTARPIPAEQRERWRAQVPAPARGLRKMTFRGGPLDGNEIEDCDLLPGITLVFPRIPEAGSMVQDYYLVTDDGGKLVGDFTGTEAIPEPPVWPDDPGDQVPAIDPLIKATAAAFRSAGTFVDDAGEVILRQIATAIEALAPENDMCCPVCEETTCDEGCPLAPVRSRWYAEGLARLGRERNE